MFFLVNYSHNILEASGQLELRLNTRDSAIVKQFEILREINTKILESDKINACKYRQIKFSFKHVSDALKANGYPQSNISNILMKKSCHGNNSFVRGVSWFFF